jgi:SAM-dependent methyltransferase
MKSDIQELNSLIMGMRSAFSKGENAMAYARANSTLADNTLVSTLIAYDLQAGSYVAIARKDPDCNNKWCSQLADLIQPYVETGDRVLEVGVGEGTTLAGVMNVLEGLGLKAYGLDVSWSRIKVAQEWADENVVNARFFVGDLFHIPLADNSIDVIYTSHSLEPNGGKETMAITELLRVARKAVVLVEPIYELAPKIAQQRMVEHGYVRDLKLTAEKLGANVVNYGLLDFLPTPLNPSGVVLMVKSNPPLRSVCENWQCPMTGTILIDHGDVFYAEQVGVAYPVMRGIPLLRPEHAVLASSFSSEK